MPVRPVSVGERIKRREDPRLIRGLATYTDDLKLHGMLHAAFVRSDYAAGKIEKIDASRALRAQGRGRRVHLRRSARQGRAHAVRGAGPSLAATPSTRCSPTASCATSASRSRS